MATPTTLTERVQQRLATWEAEKAAAQSAVQTAQTELTAAQQSLEVNKKAYADGEKAIAAIRIALATVATPADAAPLLVQLQAAIIEQRATTAAIVADDAALTQAREEVEVAREQLRAADADLANEQAELVATQLEQSKRDAAKAAVALPLLSTVATLASDLLASQTFVAAEERIETDFPQALLDRARERALFASKKLTRAQQAITEINALIEAQYTATGGASDQIQALEDALAEKEAQLFDFVARGMNRLDIATATLARLADPTYVPVTVEEHAAIDDPALATDRANAATAESDRDTAIELHEEAKATYELEELKVLADSGSEGVTAALADATSPLALAKVDVDAAAADLQQKETDYDATERLLMDTWEAAVPDVAWRDLADFEAAQSVLTELQQNPSTYATEVTNAETALLTALLAVDDEAQALQALHAALERQHAVAGVAAMFTERSRLSALRGDI